MSDRGLCLAWSRPIAVRSSRPRSSRFIVATAWLVLLLPGPVARAQSGAHTRADAFAAAVGSGVATVDFEAITAGARLSGVTLSAPGASAARQASAALDITRGIVKSWRLRVQSGALREEIELIPKDGALELFDYSPVDGREVGSRGYSF